MRPADANHRWYSFLPVEGRQTALTAIWRHGEFHLPPTLPPTPADLDEPVARCRGAPRQASRTTVYQIGQLQELS